MYCPKCGSTIDDLSNFCTNCGCSISQYHLDSYEYHEQQTYPNAQYENNKTPRDNSKTIAIVLVVVAILIAACGIVALGKFVEDNTYVTEEITIGDYSFEAGGAFIDDTFIIDTGEREFNGVMKKCISITLNDEISSKYGWYVWKLNDKESFVYVPYVYYFGEKTYTELEYNSTFYDSYMFEKNPQSTISKSEPVLYWACEPGVYSISVRCYESEYSTSAGNTYSGNIRVNGDVIKSYSWSFNDDEFETEISFPLEEFTKYSDMNPDHRTVWDYSDSTKYVVVNDTIREISTELIDLYIEAYGEDVSLDDQRFADYILAFVQYCFEYPANSPMYNGDLVMYGANEYYAYPMETIYLGYGDCEDTSILCAAIYSACGYDSAVCIIPGHAMVGVALEDYVEPTHSSSYRILKQTINGKTYYGGETTDDEQLAVGLSTKDSSGKWFTDSIGKEDYGFYPVTSS